MKVIIQGAGIAGLTLAAALQKKGIEFLLIEKAAEIRAVGAGIVLGSNALLELAKILELPKLTSLGLPLQELRILDARGQSLMSTPSRIDESAPEALGIHRHAIHSTLLAELPSQKIRLGVEVQSFTQVDRHLSIELSDGTRLEADYLIGADGLRSAVRTKLFEDQYQPQFTGYTCWRAVLEYSLPEPRVALELWGTGRRFGIVPISSTEVYVFATLNVSREAYEKRETDLPAKELLERFSGFSPLVRDIWRSAVSRGKLIHNDLEELPRHAWGYDRVILIGDAAHAMTPNLGQGAAMGIEDATCLATLLAERAGVENTVLRQLVSLRHSRVEWIAKKSRELGRIGQMENTVGIWARNRALKLTPNFMVRENTRQILNPSNAGGSSGGLKA